MDFPAYNFEVEFIGVEWLMHEVVDDVNSVKILGNCLIYRDSDLQHCCERRFAVYKLSAIFNQNSGSSRPVKYIPVYVARAPQGALTDGNLSIGCQRRSPDLYQS